MTVADDPEELRRLNDVYDRLQEKLLDLTKRNRMLSYSLSGRSKKHLQIVDEVLEEVYKKFVESNASLRIDPLEEPDDIPPEERSRDFMAALEHAKVSDIEYLTKLQALENIGRDDEFEMIKLERQLRDKVRGQLGLPPRPKKGEVNPAEHARQKGIDPNFELKATKSKPSHTDLALQTLKFPEDVETIMGKIVADARLAEQEMGISTLFLAFGFLEWYESDDSDKKAFAPLLLLPVKIESKKFYGKTVYSIAATEDAAEPNLSLQKLLEKIYDRKLPSFEASDEDRTSSIESYLDAVRTSIINLNRWQVHRWLVLGHFAFGRFAMYADLDPENWSGGPLSHPIIRSILRGKDDSKNDGTFRSDPEDYPIDDPEIEKIAPLIIQDADASQHSALVDVMRENNLVIQGPPGTGKSQTISNIIAAALAADKTVLFVAEKLAALDVVKRKLEKCGLGDFCLELHSDKAAPKFVIESLKQRRAVKSVSAPVMQDATWRENRKEITKYLNALHSKHDDGQTPFDLIWAALRGRTLKGGALEAFKAVKLPDHLLSDPAVAASAKDRVDLFAAAHQRFLASHGHPVDLPWYRTSLDDVASFQASDLVQRMRDIAQTALGLLDCIASNTHIGVASLVDLPVIIAVNAALGSLPDAELVGTTAVLDETELTRALRLKLELHEIKAALAALPDIGEQDLSMFVNASKISNLGLPEVFLDHPAAELARIATETIERITTLRTAIEMFRPALKIFGVDGSFPVSGLAVLAKAAMASKLVPQEYHAPMRTHLVINEQEFAEVHSRWSIIWKAEQEWRNRLPTHGHRRWPQSSAIRQAAGTLNKKWFGRALAGLDGSSKSSRQALARLGFDDAAIANGDVECLATHIDTLNAFDEDPKAANLLGASWHGISTAFNEIADGIKARRVLTDKIGSETTQQLIRVPLAAVPTLNLLADVAKQMHDAIQKVNDLIDDRAVDLTLEMRANEVNTMKEVLDLVGQWKLPQPTAPVGDIAKIGKFKLRAHQLTQTLDGAPLKYAAESLGKSVADINRVFAALDWIRTVRKIPMPTALLQCLTSSAAGKERARLKTEAERASRLIAAYTQHMLAIQGFGVAGYAELDLTELAKNATTLVEYGAQLPDFLALLAERRRLEAIGLGDFVARAYECRIEPDQLTGTLAALVATGRAYLARKAAPEIESNNGSTLDARRKQFADRDRAKIEINRTTVKAKLLTRLPLAGASYGKKTTWTEMALINSEIEKQKRFVPVRSLLARAGRSVQALKPCFMMSPLSLAKFMKPGLLNFDLLVIDEASQMRPEDALGAIHRCKQIVVVGDPKQLPPTDFFNRSMDDAVDEESDDLDDELILDCCQKSFGQRRSLKWHYRSQCESLIRFSNENFYRRELITFPAAKPGSFSIDLVRVNGAYQARCNPAEATCIVEQAVLFMRHYADSDEASIPTLGIVAVNTAQRDLIQDELRRMISDDPQVDKYREKVESRGEELFVKNLENVQGDERDFIFISMTYGFEPGATAMKQRFGPINGKQGHRRLNVLFSRARMRIGLFTSFGSADVAPTEMSSDGVHILRRYLEYAEVRGRSAASGDGPEPDSDFEVEVADRLRAKNYVVDYQVGVSSYKIDLGVRHPDFPEQYLVGIECDGARYHSSKSARDRDRIREEVLQSKGWNLIRVWSTDWFENADIQTLRLIQRIEEIRKIVTFDRADYPSLATPLSGQRRTMPGDDIPVAPIPSPTVNANPVVASEHPAPAQARPPVNGGSDMPAPTGDVAKKQYILTTFTSDLIRPDASRFYDPDYQSTLARMIEHIIKVEAPIYEDLVIERISRTHGFQRSGEKIQAIVSKAISQKFLKSDDDGRAVIWAEKSTPGEPHPFRDSHADIRSHTDIPVAELASLARPFVELLGDDEAILYSMADHFKLGRLREPTRCRFQAAIDLARKTAVQPTPKMGTQAAVQFSLSTDNAGLTN